MKQSLLIVLIFHLLSVSTYGRNDEFINFSSDNNKLTNNITEAIVRDHQGYVWVGTVNGLNRLDGYSVKNYLNNPADSLTISANFIKSLFVDNDGDLWIGTIGGGLNLYNRKNDSFIRFNSNNKTSSFDGFNVSVITQDQSDNIWIGTIGHGLYCYNKRENTFKKYLLDPRDPHNTNISTLLCDKENNIWVGFDFESNGIYKINTKTDAVSFCSPKEQQGKATNLGPVRGLIQLLNGQIIVATWGGRFYEVNKHNDNELILIYNEYHLNQTAISHMIKDKDDNIYISCWENGLCILNQDLQIQKWHTENKCERNTLASNNINFSYIDNQNVLWLAHRNAGVSLLSLNKPTIQNLLTESATPNAYESIDVQAIDKDMNGNLWFATRGQGLWKYNTITKVFKQYSKEQNKDLTTNFLLTLKVSSDGSIWIGSDGKFILHFDPASEKFTSFDFNWSDWTAVFALAETKDHIWAGTWGSGIKKINKKTIEITNIDFDTNDQYRNSIFDLEIIDSTLWVANIGIGLYKVDLRNDKLTPILSNDDKTTGLNNIRINDLYYEKPSKLWLSTSGLGAICYDINNGQYQIINNNNGVSSNIVQSVAIDNIGNHWFWEQSGVTVFKNGFKNSYKFFTHNGFLSNINNMSSSYFDSENNLMYLGSQLGINVFNPEKVNIDTVVNEVVFTRINVMGKTQKPTQQNDEKTPTITLSPRDNIITISFSAMEFSPSFLNSYRYKLEGFDKEWNSKSHIDNTAQYTNLNPGEYFFKVKAINSDGFENEKASAIKIIVKPAFYQTILFKIFTILSTLLILFVFINFRHRNLKRAKEELERKVAIRTNEIEQQKHYIEKQNQQLEESNASKDRFFSIIGHDLTNPMSTIDQLLELLELDFDTMKPEATIKLIKHLKNSSEQTLNLLKNLTTWAQTQTNRIKINKTSIAISKLFDEVKLTCEIQAKNKNQVLLFNTSTTHIGFFDYNTINTVLRNLITNAIKFSNVGSTIEIKSNLLEKTIVISVKDHGIGIKKEELDNLFDIKTVQSKKGTNKELGTGLGLIICHEFIALNDGEIWVESEIDKGSTFFFSIEKYKNGTLEFDQLQIKY